MSVSTQGQHIASQPNSGHGHVFPRPDGVKVRCAGPAFCKVCALDLAQKQAAEPASPEAKEPAILVQEAKDCVQHLGSIPERDYERQVDATEDAMAAIDALGALLQAAEARASAGNSLLRRPIKHISELGPCHCLPDHCSAPVIMGRQTPCLRNAPKPPDPFVAHWVRVEDRMPEKNVEVLIAFRDTPLPATGQYTASPHDTWGWCFPKENDPEETGPVIAWMPLPEHPSEVAAAHAGGPAE